MQDDPNSHRSSHLVLTLAQMVASIHCAGGPVLAYLHQTNQSPEPLVDIYLRIGAFILKPALFIIIQKPLFYKCQGLVALYP